jgi:hypothetical protein
MRILYFISIILYVVFLISCKGEPKQQVETVGERYENLKVDFMRKGSSDLDIYITPIAEQLRFAVEMEDIDGAMKICSNYAEQIIKSRNEKHGWDAKRVSLRPRNSANAPTDIDIEIMNDIDQRIKGGEMAKPGSRLMGDNSVKVFQPIIAEHFCLPCHGVVDRDIKPSVYSKIKEKYPDDLATGYNIGDLIGIWIYTSPNSNEMLQID